MAWADLLKSYRVVVLAEAGAGKTREMQEQPSRLSRDGGAAFFLPLESLDRSPLTELLSGEEEARLGAWQTHGTAPAWFFLDAVDELKLTAGKLDRALLRLSKALHGHVARSRVVMSCRPNDWRHATDLATL